MAQPDGPEHAGGRLGRAFGRFWLSYTVSAAGSALSAGALPLIAILVLQAGPLQVSLLAVIGSIASAVLSLPLGVLIERSEKRTVLIVTDLMACGALLTVPLTAVGGWLTYPQLCVVAAVSTTCSIVSVAASLAYVKAVIPLDARVAANARLDSVNWTTYAVGPPAGGALIGVTGPTVTVVTDAVSFLLSALLLRRIPRASPPRSEEQAPRVEWKQELWAGWRLILGHSGLRALYFNALVLSPVRSVVAPTRRGPARWCLVFERWPCNPSF